MTFRYPTPAILLSEDPDFNLRINRAQEFLPLAKSSKNGVSDEFDPATESVEARDLGNES